MNALETSQELAAEDLSKHRERQEEVIFFRRYPAVVIRCETMPDELTTTAVLYGPLVLAGKLGSEGLTKEMIGGPLGPEVDKHPMQVPQLRGSKVDPDAWLKRTDGEGLQFQP